MKRIFSIILTLMPLLAMGAPVSWTSSVEMTSPTEGRLIIHASIEPGWHIYDTDVAGEPKLSTHVTAVADNPAVTWSDEMAASPAPTSNIDPLFHIRAGWWEGEVTFSRHFTIAPGASATISGEVYYLTCDAQRCAEPTTYRFETPVNQPQAADASLDASDASAVRPTRGGEEADTLSAGAPAPALSPAESRPRITASQYCILALMALGAGLVGGLAGAWIFTRNNKTHK